jgi:hypothetical protein
MASIISAGTTSGTALNMTADTSGQLQLATGSSATTAVTIDTSQNVGIGTTSPNKTGFASPVLSITNGTSGVVELVGTQAADGTVGQVAWYNTSGTARIGQILGLRSGANDSGAITFQTASAGSLAERMRIDSSGNLFLGQTAYTTPPTQTVDFFSGGLIINPTRRTTGSAANCFWNSADGVFYRSTSSLRYKTDVQDAIHGLSDVLKLRPITYKGKSESDEGKIFGGFLAEEVDEIGLKEFVEYDVDNKPDSLAYGNMVSLLTKAIQEQQTIINDLKARVEALGAK